MTDTYLIGASKIKELSPVHDNVDNDIIKQSILTCQQMYLEPTIGSGLYDYIIDNVDSLNSDYTTLLEKYIHPVLLHWVLADIVDILTYRYTNIGVQTKSGENSLPIGAPEVRRMRNRYRNRADAYSRDLWDYLCENNDTFPLFDNPGDGYDVKYPARRKYNTGIYVNRRRGRDKDEPPLRNW